MTPEVERLRGKIEGATLDEQVTRIDELIAERDAAYAKGYEQAMTDEGYGDRRTGSMSENDDG